MDYAEAILKGLKFIKALQDVQGGGEEQIEKLIKDNITDEIEKVEAIKEAASEIDWSFFGQFFEGIGQLLANVFGKKE